MSTGGSFLPPDLKLPNNFSFMDSFAPQGPMFPTQNVQGGWQMPQAQAPTPPPPPPPAPNPGPGPALGYTLPNNPYQFVAPPPAPPKNWWETPNSAA